MTRWWMCLALAACGGEDDTDPVAPIDTDVTEANSGSEDVCEHAVPRAGNDPSPRDWISDDTNVTPEDAWPVGVIDAPTDAPLYVQTVLPADERNAYFVFKAGGDFDVTLRVQNSTNPFKHLHLHEAPDRCFGDEVPAIDEDVGSWYIENTFPVEEGLTYVMEVRVPGGGFF